MWAQTAGTRRPTSDAALVLVVHGGYGLVLRLPLIGVVLLLRPAVAGEDEHVAVCAQ